MSGLRDRLRTLAWLLPAGRAKNSILTRLGHPIHPTAIARCSLVLDVGVISMGANSRIGRWNAVKGMKAIRLEDSASIGRLNVITAHPVFGRLYADGAMLSLGSHSFVTSRHRLDCSGAVRVGEYAGVAGHGSSILTHSIDLAKDAQAAYPVVIGPRSFVGTGCLLLGGAEMPENSVLAGGSVLPKSKKPRDPGLWAGVPARHRGPVEGDWFTRSATSTRRVFVPDTGEIVEDAF